MAPGTYYTGHEPPLYFRFIKKATTTKKEVANSKIMKDVVAIKIVIINSNKIISHYIYNPNIVFSFSFKYFV